jgi:hypothetical protein
MKTRKIAKFFRKLVLLSSCCFLTGSMAAQYTMASDAAGKGEKTSLEGRIMMVDLEQDYLVVSEKNILLHSQIENGTKKWNTNIVDENGKEMPPSSLRERDRVVVEGTVLVPTSETEAGTIDADKITVETNKGEKDTIKKHEESSPAGSPVYNSNGVWKN